LQFISDNATPQPVQDTAAGESFVRQAQHTIQVKVIVERFCRHSQVEISE